MLFYGDKKYAVSCQMEKNDHLQREAELMCRLDKSWTPYNVYIESWCETILSAPIFNRT